MKYGTIHRSLPQLGQWVSDESSHSPHASQCFPARFVGRPSESSSIDMSDIAEIISRSSLLPVAAPEWLPGSSRQHVTLQSFRPPLRPPTRRQVRGALKKHRLTCTLFVGLPRFELGTYSSRWRLTRGSDWTYQALSKCRVCSQCSDSMWGSCD